jgi:uncharacterized membrane protein
VAWYAYNALFVAGVAYPLGIVAAWAGLFAMGQMSSAAEAPGFLFYTYLIFSPVIVFLAFFYLPFAMALARWNPAFARRGVIVMSGVALLAITLLMLDSREGEAHWIGSAGALIALAMGVRLTPEPPRWWAWLVGFIPASGILMVVITYAGLWLGLWM